MVRNKKRIVVLGGGFAGLECTRKLESHFKNDREIEIILVSEDNFLLFTPMLPQDILSCRLELFVKKPFFMKVE